ncbi:unnamed protein product [Durusdinium trenchii]|uniref:Pseudouridine synthase RsuA/RluA-like domain-containing protein n=1 Tax=Durusdinium trenchii TaxID=1381693 RepID=A0ABP0NY94_9DINO
MLPEQVQQLRRLTLQISGSPWYESLRLLYSLPGLQIQLDAVAFSACMNACEKGSKWDCSLHLYDQMPLRRVEADLFCCNAAIHACSKGEGGDAWQIAVEALHEMQEASDADVVSFSSVIAAIGVAQHWQQATAVLNLMSEGQVSANTVAYLNTITAYKKSRWEMLVALPYHREEPLCNAAAASIPWFHAMNMLADMQLCRIRVSPITTQAVIGSCERDMQWLQALHVMRSIHTLQVVADERAYNAAMSACQSSSASQGASSLLKDMRRNRISQSCSATLWSLARLGEDDVQMATATTAAVSRASCELRSEVLSPQHLAMLAWSITVLGVANLEFLELLSKQAMLQSSRFTLEELRHLLWGLAAQEATEGVTVAILHLQRNALHRFRTLNLALLAAEKRKAMEDDILNILWASNFAGMLSVHVRCLAERLFQRFARSLDRSPSPESSAAIPPLGAGRPKIVLDLDDRMVMLKPAGWEVCDGNVGRQLRGLLSGFSTLRSADHDHGFLHRVDVPCSGLILFAKSFRAFYDLQVQLRAGEIRRDYLVLCHGWMPSDRSVEANIDTRGDPTRTGRLGKPSRSFIKLAAHALGAFGVATMIIVRIATGRRHQIRSHVAFIGHPVVRDEKFTAWQTQVDDFLFCDRVFLHRYSLMFKDSRGELQAATNTLPADLTLPLSKLTPKSPRFAAPLQRWQSGTMAWDEKIERPDGPFKL